MCTSPHSDPEDLGYSLCTLVGLLECPLPPGYTWGSLPPTMPGCAALPFRLLPIRNLCELTNLGSKSVIVIKNELKLKEENPNFFGERN